jgi:hypothetical protein
VLRDLGEIENARNYLAQAVSIRELALGPDHPETLRSMNDLDQLRRDLGEQTSPWPQAPPEDLPPQFPDGENSDSS